MWLRGWLDEDRINYRLREVIGEDAAEWDRASRPDDLLPRWNSKLAAAAELSALKPHFFNELERTYLDACIHLRDREAAEREQRAKELEKALADARRQARVARAGQLAAQSQTALAEGRPQRGVLLAVEALKIEPDAGVSHLPAADQALRDALSLIGGCGLGGHESEIRVLAFSPDGRWLATGSGDTTARLWDLRQAADPTAAPVVLRGHESEISALAFSPPPATTGAGWPPAVGTRRPGCGTCGRRIHRPRRSCCAATKARSSPWRSARRGRTAGAGWPPAVGTRRPGCGTCGRRRIHRPRRSCCAATKAGSQPWRSARTGAGWPPAVGTRRPGCGTCRRRIHRPRRSCCAATKRWIVCPGVQPRTRRWLATGSWDKTARLWDLRRRRIHRPRRSCCAATKARSMPWRSARTGAGWPPAVGQTARLWDLRRRIQRPRRSSARPRRRSCPGVQPRRALAGHRQWGQDGPAVGPAAGGIHGRAGRAARPRRRDLALAFSPDGRWLATGSRDKTARLWDLRPADPSAAPVVLRGHEGEISALAFSPGRGAGWPPAVGTGRPGCGTCGAADPSAAPVVLRGHEGADLLALAFSPDGRWLATGSRTDGPAVGPAAGGSSGRAGRAARPRRQDLALAFSPDGRWLATGSGTRRPGCGTCRAADLSAAPVVLRGHEGGSMPWRSARTGAGWPPAVGHDGPAVGLRQAADPSAAPVVLRGHESRDLRPGVQPGAI